MRDNEFFVLLKEAIPELWGKLGKPLATLPKITRNFQPTMQGAQRVPALYMAKVSSAPRGVPRQPETWNPVTGVFDTQTIQYLETAFQFMASAPVSLENALAEDAGDIAEITRTMLLSSEAKVLFRAKGVQVLRASAVRDHKIMNEENQFENFPNFDIVFSHKRAITGTAQPAPISGELYRANGETEI